MCFPQRASWVTVKYVARLLVALLVLAACSSGRPVDAAFGQIDAVLPSQLRQTSEDRSESVHRAQYEARGEPAEIAAQVRASLVAHDFMLFDDSGLPYASATDSSPSPDPRPVDAIQIRGFRAKQDIGMMRSLYFAPAARPGWTRLTVTVALQD